MNLKAQILALLVEGKTYEQIKAAILSGEIKAEGTQEEIKNAISEAFVEHEQKQQAAKAFSDIEDEKAAKKSDEELAEMIKGIVDESVKSFHEKGVLENADADIEKKFKSQYVRESVAVKSDNSWVKDFCDMVRADRSGNTVKALELSQKFLEGSKLYGAEDQKLLRGDATTGSYAVPDEFSDMVFTVAQRGSAIYEGSTKLNMGSDKLYLLGSGDVTFTEVSTQATDLTNSEPTLTQTALDAIDAGAYSQLHDNLISDSNVNMVALLSGAYGRGLAKYLKRTTAVGNVATTGDKINGIYSTSGVGSAAVADTVGGQIAYADILNLMAKIDESFWDGAMFEMNIKEMLAIASIVGTDGHPILTNPKTGDNLFRLLGFPVSLNNQMPAVLDSSTGARTGGSEATILFGNSREVQVGVKGGFILESSQHYDFIGRTTTFRGFIRWAMGVVNTSAWARLTGITRKYA